MLFLYAIFRAKYGVFLWFLQLFEFFLERKMMRHFYTFIHRPPGGKTNEYAKQALQTLGMLIQNVKNEQSLYFLFSNNFINGKVPLFGVVPLCGVPT